MELSKQVVSLELAKKLKELGVVNGNDLWWNAPKIMLCPKCDNKTPFDINFGKPSGKFCEYCGTKLEEKEDWAHINDFKEFNDTNTAYYPAYTATELTNMLPDLPDVWLSLCRHAEHGWDVTYERPSEYIDYPVQFQSDVSLSNALAKLVITMIENKLMTPTATTQEEE